MNLAFFKKMEGKFRKHSSPSLQTGNKPLLSNFVDYGKIKHKKALDIACGTGFITAELAKHGADVTGIDLTQYATDATNKNLEVRKLNGKAIKMDAQNLKFDNGTFNVVTAHGCLMHMPDTEKAIKEINRVLMKKGMVYAWMYHKGWYYYFNVMLVRGILMGGFFKYGFNMVKLTSRFSDGAHVGGNPLTKFYSKKQFKKMFGDAGFKNVKVTINYQPAEFDVWPLKPVPIGKYILPGFLRKFMSQKLGFGYSCTITAVK